MKVDLGGGGRWGWLNGENFLQVKISNYIVYSVRASMCEREK